MKTIHLKPASKAAIKIKNLLTKPANGGIPAGENSDNVMIKAGFGFVLTSTPEHPKRRLGICNIIIINLLQNHTFESLVKILSFLFFPSGKNRLVERNKRRFPRHPVGMHP
jgi:hypothetical protein